MVETNWHIREYSEEELQLVDALVRDLQVSQAEAKMLVVRGLRSADEARAYIRPSLSQLHDPMLMADMPAGVERLHRALQQNEKILVYGDYDVDGTTAVALMYSFLRKLTDRLDYYIPDRDKEGYGISFRGIDYAQQEGCTLVIALDCGIKAVDKIEYANARAIDFIICDHHTPGDTLPDAVAVINMKRADCPYPYKHLSGCGVGFKLAHAYCRQYGLDAEDLLFPLLPLLSMSIASDVVPMTGENRILETFGLKEINRAPSVGVKAMLEVAGLVDKPVTVSDLVYRIGPRINACGRLYSGREAVELLITTDPQKAETDAKAIDDHNQERRDFDNQVTEEALEMLKADPDNDKKYTTVVFSPNWHKGVVGIAASRLTETYYRPTIVLTASEDGLISGSARSVAGFDVYKAIDSCSDLLPNFGGHAFAAGLSMREKDLPEFKRRFEEYVAQHILPDQQKPTIEVEAEIELREITPHFYNVIRCLEPYGPENPRPIFVTRGLQNNRYTKRVGDQGKHLKVDLRDAEQCISGIGFGMGEMAMPIQNGAKVDVCYSIEPNTYNGVTTLQMKVEDIQIN